MFQTRLITKHSQGKQDASSCVSLCRFFKELTFVPRLVSVNERVTPVAKAAGHNL